MKTNLRKLVATLAILAVAGVTYAASVHFKGKPALKLTDNGLTLSACGALAGLGNGDVTITLVADGDIFTICTNPGGNEAPGQNPAEAVVLGDVSIPSNQIKNGSLSFCVTTVAPATPTPAEAGCPNNNWTVRIADVNFSGATLLVEQGGNVVLRKTL